MKIKSLLIGSAADLVAVTGAKAADAVVVAEPEPTEYVRVCDAYGSGFFYIPGTETCLRVSGYVWFQMQTSGNQDTTSTAAAGGLGLTPYPANASAGQIAAVDAANKTKIDAGNTALGKSAQSTGLLLPARMRLGSAAAPA